MDEMHGIVIYFKELVVPVYFIVDHEDLESLMEANASDTKTVAYVVDHNENRTVAINTWQILCVAIEGAEDEEED